MYIIIIYVIFIHIQPIEGNDIKYTFIYIVDVWNLYILYAYNLYKYYTYNFYFSYTLELSLFL